MATQTVTRRPAASRAPFARKLVPYAYLSPMLISIAVLSLAPMLFNIYLAFTDADLYTFKTGISGVGLTNFIEVFQGSFSKVFFPVLGWTILYAVLATLSQYFVGMFIALRLNNPHMRESRFYRALLVIPWAIPGTIAVLAWQGMFNTSYGSINRWLEGIFHIAKIPWLQDPNLAKVAVLVVNLWLGFPYFMSICLGSLQSIPAELYEVADIDGASGWTKFWRVTFPMLIRFTIPLMIASFAFNFNNFSTAFLMTGGGPNRIGPFNAGYTDILASVSYKLVVNLNRYGLGAAVSLVLFVLVAGLSLFNMKATGAFGGGEED
ncbi:MAG TPA: ABC transporter permease subunit [Symbiobacteriaceae bacterium]|nr:ABC transporter permease subunit [Symbiobacteriaceae bacterium]